jgi:hypothetical protein
MRSRFELSRIKIKVLLDVRETAWSHKPGFSVELHVSQATISRDLEVLRTLWRSESLRNTDDIVALELKKLEQTEREAWDAWNRSKAPRVFKSGASTELKGGATKTGRGKATGGKVVKAMEETLLVHTSLPITLCKEKQSPCSHSFLRHSTRELLRTTSSTSRSSSSRKIGSYPDFPYLCSLVNLSEHVSFTTRICLGVARVFGSACTNHPHALGQRIYCSLPVSTGR